MTSSSIVTLLVAVAAVLALGIVVLAFLLLRDPVWRDRPSSEQALHQPASLQNAS